MIKIKFSNSPFRPKTFFTTNCLDFYKISGVNMMDYRMDFNIEIVEDIDDTHLTVKLIPDPKRYEFKTVDGEEGYWDKFDEIFISLDIIRDMAPNMKNLPLFYSPKDIEDIEKYTNERIEHLRKSEYDLETYELCDKSEDFLESLQDDNMRFVILSIDIKGSTKMSQDLDVRDNSKIISLFSSEISQLIGGFNGYVLKYLGDGIIAYFPEPNYIGMNDNAIDCANSIKYFILKGLNTILTENGLPPINFRIGLDSGEAMIMTIGSRSTKMHKDLIGQTINLATKIQSLAQTNQILAGDTTIRNAHYSYREQFEKVELPEDWSYFKTNIKSKYPVYASRY